jgi:hypothetical protein
MALTSATSPIDFDLDSQFNEAIGKVKEYVEQEKFQKSMVVAHITKEYDAIVDEKGIHVGCQLVTFEKFDELLEVVTQVRENLKK